MVKLEQFNYGKDEQTDQRLSYYTIAIKLPNYHVKDKFCNKPFPELQPFLGQKKLGMHELFFHSHQWR